MQQQFSRIKSDWEAGLSSELWASIFCRLTPEESVLACTDCCIHSEAQQAQCCQLRLVCQRFRDILRQDLQLSRRIALSRQFAIHLLPSFEFWLQRHGKALQNVKSYNGTTCLEATLSLLRQAAPGLVQVQINSCSPLAVKLVSSFTSIVVCELETSGGLDVDALQAMRSLRLLSLQGACWSRFSAVQLPHQLTQFIFNAGSMNVAESCNSVSLLRSLTVKGSLKGLHDQGLPACVNLQTLIIPFSASGSCISSKGSGSFNTSSYCPYFLTSPHLATLTCLRELYLACQLSPHAPVAMDLSPLYALTSLETLTLQWQTGGVVPPLKILSGISALSRLTQLHLYSVCAVFVDVEWQAMHVLQDLTLSGKLSCTESMLALSGLTSLTHLDFSYCKPCNAASTGFIETLIDNMKEICPVVKVLPLKTSYCVR